MNISDLLSEKMVLADVEAESKRDLLEKLSNYVAQEEGLDKNTIYEAILERENLGPTGYGNGVAFPHARINGLTKVCCVFARMAKPLDFEAIDAHPVDLIAFLISPEKSGEDHLQALVVFSRALKNDSLCQQIRAARNAHEIYIALQR